MPILAEIGASVSFASGAAPYGRLTARVHVTESGDTGLAVDVDLDATILDAARPRSAADTQVVGFRVYIDGVLQDMSKFTGGINVSIPADGSFAQWSLSCAADDSPFGSPLAYAGPPPGKKNVTIKGVHKTSTGLHEFPLVTNGISDNCQLISNESGHLLVLNGAGPGARYDRKKISYSLKPGHGLARGEVVRRLAVEAGVPDFLWSAPWGNESNVQIDLDEPMYKEVQAVNEDFLTLAKGIAWPMLRVPHWTRSGQLGLGYQYHTSYTGAVGDSPPVIVVTEADILLADGVTMTSVSDVPTTVTFTGTEQMVREEEGRRTEVVTVESYAYYSPAVASHIQGLGGALSASGRTARPAELMLVSRVITETEYEGDTIHSERTRTWGWYKPIAARYGLANDPDSTITSYVSGVYLYDASATADDGNQAYAWPTEQFVLLSDEIITRVYDERGYETTTIQEARGWKHIVTAVKNRTGANISWDTTDYILNLLVLASGEGSAFPFREVYSGDIPSFGYDESTSYGNGSTEGAPYLEKRTTTRDVDELGRVQREETTVRGWGILGGSRYLYHGGDEGEFPGKEVVFDKERRVTTYIEHEEGNHTEVVQVFDASGRLVEQIRTAKEGNLPAANLDLDISPDEDVYDTAEQRERARFASRFESRPIKVTVSSPALLATKEVHEVIESNEWAESVGHLEKLAFHRIMDASAAEVSFSTPCNFLFPEGPRIHLRVRPLGIDHDAVVRRVTYNWPGPGSPITTQVEARVFAV